MVEEYLDIYEEVDEDQKSKCRLCANEEKNKYLIHIFGKMGRKYALDIKIRKCLPIAVREDDGMPKGVCLSCINKLDVSCELVDACMRAQCTFLSLMNHDPARAKSERLAVVEDDECEDQSITEDPAEVALEELSDSVSTQPVEDFEMPVVIKDEPMDLGESEEEIADPIEKEPPTWLEMALSGRKKPLKIVDNSAKTIEAAEPSTSDALNNISVESVPEEPQLSDSLPPPTVGSISVRSTDTLLQSPAAPGISSDIAIETPAEVEPIDMENIAVIQQSSAKTSVFIKEEPPGSPSRSFAQSTSEVPTASADSAEDAASVSTAASFGVTDISDISSVPQ